VSRLGLASAEISNRGVETERLGLGLGLGLQPSSN